MPDLSGAEPPLMPYAPRIDLTGYTVLLVTQRFEAGEFLGFETRNRYRIFDRDGLLVGYAAEPRDGAVGFLARQFLGHWRSFDLQFFNVLRRPAMLAHHPFRFYFTRLDLYDATGGRIGGIERRFGLLSKRLVIEDAGGRVVMEVCSPIWRLWTFPFMAGGRQRAKVSKRWSGGFSELVTDRDDFLVEFTDPRLTNAERLLVLTAAIYIDLTWFERKR
ncbi:MAG: hypothetical protein RIS35_3095 [Pseudomonadota bacterium]